MTKILLFGDSNTWGYVSGTFTPNPFYLERFDSKTRWPGIVKKLLGSTFEFFEESLPGRTIKTDNPHQPGINGYTYLQSLSHRLLDGVVVMLGSNDIQENYSLSPKQIGQHLEDLCELIQEYHLNPTNNRNILIIAPPQLGILTDKLFTPAYQNVKHKVFELKEEFQDLTARKDYFFLDASGIVPGTETDGIHLGKIEHFSLAELVVNKLREMFE